MAKPINSTPTLRGKDARRLIEKMRETESRKPNKQEISMAKSIKEIKIAEVVGEGIHTGLRKWADSEGSTKAYNGIREMPDEEWEGICNEVASYVKQELSDVITDKIKEIEKGCGYDFDVRIPRSVCGQDGLCYTCKAKKQVLWDLLEVGK